MALASLEAVVFDWGDTLVAFPGYTTSRDRHVACVDALFGALRSEGHAHCFADADAARERFRRGYEAACAQQLEYTRRTGREHRLHDRLADTLRAAGCRCPLESPALEALVDRFAGLLLHQTRLIEAAPAVLQALRARYRLGLLANYPWAPLVRRTLAGYGLEGYFEAVAVSGELGWAKPRPEAFRAILDRLGVEPARTLFVGDDLVNDVRGAKAMGFVTAWIAPGRPADEPAADHRLERLADLLGVLGGAPDGAAASG